MKPTTFENAIRLQFDTLVKRVIDTTVKDYDRHMKFLSDHEKSFCELPEIKVNSFAIQDDYEMDVTVFDVYGMEAWSYVKKKYKLNTTNFLFLCNC